MSGINPANSPLSIRQPYSPSYTRGQANRAELRVSRANAPVTLASATYTLINPSGTTIVTGAATITAGYARYELTSTHLPSTAALSRGYMETWAITETGQDPTVHQRTVIVARRGLQPPCAISDLEDRFSRLSTLKPRDQESWQPQLDAAWGDVLRKLTSEGLYPARLIDPSALFAPHLHAAQIVIYGVLAAGDPTNTTYPALRAQAIEDLARAWRESRGQIDRDDDGRSDDEGNTTNTPTGVIFLGAARAIDTRISGW